MTFFSSFNIPWYAISKDIAYQGILKELENVKRFTVFFFNFLFHSSLPASFRFGNQWTGFYMIGTSVMEGLSKNTPFGNFRCCLLHITIIIPRHISYLVYLCPYLGLVLFMAYLCDSFSISSLIFIIINNIIHLNQIHCFLHIISY